MTDDEWKRRESALMVAFLTGRPVFSDSEGKLRFADGDHGALFTDSEGRQRFADGDRAVLADDVNVPKTALPEARVQRTWWARLKRWFGS